MVISLLSLLSELLLSELDSDDPVCVRDSEVATEVESEAVEVEEAEAEVLADPATKEKVDSKRRKA